MRVLVICIVCVVKRSLVQVEQRWELYKATQELEWDLFKISKNGVETQRLDDAAGEKWKLRWCAKEMNFSCEHNDVGSVKKSVLQHPC